MRFSSQSNVLGIAELITQAATAIPRLLVAPFLFENRACERMQTEEVLSPEEIHELLAQSETEDTPRGANRRGDDFPASCSVASHGERRSDARRIHNVIELTGLIYRRRFFFLASRSALRFFFKAS